MRIIGIMKDFEILMELLVRNNSTPLSGNEKWIDWDSIYSDLLDEGYASEVASELLDQYIEENDYA